MIILWTIGIYDDVETKPFLVESLTPSRQICEEKLWLAFHNVKFMTSYPVEGFGGFFIPIVFWCCYFENLRSGYFCHIEIIYFVLC